jgi:hypothetical protein
VNIGLVEANLGSTPLFYAPGVILISFLTFLGEVFQLSRFKGFFNVVTMDRLRTFQFTGIYDRMSSDLVTTKCNFQWIQFLNSYVPLRGLWIGNGNTRSYLVSERLRDGELNWSSNLKIGINVISKMCRRLAVSLRLVLELWGLFGLLTSYALELRIWEAGGSSKKVGNQKNG